MILEQGEVGHRFERESRIGAAHVNAGHRDSRRREPFTDEQNDSEGFLHDPVLEVNDAEPAKNQQANKRQQTIAPLHSRDVATLFLDCQSRSRKALVDLWNHRQSAPYARAGDADYS
jgi:hypothetical protein